MIDQSRETWKGLETVSILSLPFFNSSSTATCKAGSFSPTGLMPCFPCQKGAYQSLEGQRSCLKCRANTTTPGEGSNSSVECGGKNLLNNNFAIFDQLETEIGMVGGDGDLPSLPLHD